LSSLDLLFTRNKEIRDNVLFIIVKPEELNLLEWQRKRDAKRRVGSDFITSFIKLTSRPLPPPHHLDDEAAVSRVSLERPQEAGAPSVELFHGHRVQSRA
jgi:hypothetical protein